MKPRTSRPALIILSLALLSCGGGGADPNSPKSPASAQEVTGTGAASSACTPLQASNQGIEGTGRRQKLTGRITALGTTGSVGPVATVTVGSSCFSASGATVFQDATPASLSDLSVDQIITAIGQFDTVNGAYANSIYILPTTPRAIQELRMQDQFNGGNWHTFNWGPEVSMESTATVLVDGGQVPVAGLSIDANEIALITGVLTFDANHNPGGLLSAERIEISHPVEGPIDAIDLTHSALVVLGLTVFLDGQTGGNLSALHVGERVRVSGYASASGAIAATLVAPSAASGDYLVTNFVTAIDTTRKQLQIAGLLVDYSASALQDFPAGGPQAGQRVRIKGGRSAAGVVATSLAYLSPKLPGSPGDLASLNGLVTAVATASDVSVDGYAVTVSEAVIQACGAPPTIDTPVTLDGTVQPGGNIAADEFCSGGGIRTYKWMGIGGTVDAIDPQFGTLSILGFDVQPSLTTSVFDEATGTPLTRSDIHVGDSVGAHGFPDSSNKVLLADGLERLAMAPSPEVNVYHEFASYADPIVYVLGRPITVTADAVFSGFVPPVTRSQFFSEADNLADPDCGPAYNFKFIIERGTDGSLTTKSVEYHLTRC